MSCVDLAQRDLLVNIGKLMRRNEKLRKLRMCITAQLAGGFLLILTIVIHYVLRFLDTQDTVGRVGTNEIVIDVSAAQPPSQIARSWRGRYSTVHWFDEVKFFGTQANGDRIENVYVTSLTDSFSYELHPHYRIAFIGLYCTLSTIICAGFITTFFHLPKKVDMLREPDT